MPATFDNIEDVNGKFAGTICYYDKKPVMVKSAQYNNDDMKRFQLLCTTVGGRGKMVNLEDPAFDYVNYNIGYVNNGYHAPWYYRKPLKQFRQGLKKDQLGYQLSDPTVMLDENFGFTKAFLAMLENDYPEREECKHLLKNGTARVVAFHRDFALAWDYIHQDYVLEYRGKRVGLGLNDKLTEYRLIDEYKHLTEVVAENIG